MERVNTGGLTEIRYPKGHKIKKASEQEKEDIRNAYEQANKRKKKERIIKIAIIVGIIIILAYYLLN